ncbi:MAG: hypothetical protein OXP68_07560 [Anaerolineaceae bacterium]|nr:hypothetical protein [Anaerolineaceae bacterium]MDE0330024.1 hypothetical protein [Anaerolineaceae bacterium]
MALADLHAICFNMYILYMLALGVWAAGMAARDASISGGFWGAVAISAGVAGITLLVGVALTLQGLRPQRLLLYFLYMLFLLVIMPGLFSLLRGRDDRHAALAFSILALFNASTAFSMTQRSVTGPWSTPVP